MSDSKMDTVHETRGLMLSLEALPNAYTPEIQRRLNDYKAKLDLIFHYEFMARMIEGL
jgi:hypothetical protein